MTIYADFRSIPTVGTHRKNEANYAFPPWEYSVPSVGINCLFRPDVVCSVLNVKEALNSENNITMSHRKSLTVSTCDIVILKIEKTIL